ncbi:cell division protein FtsQ [Histidinibacterium lentulum]|uniref:Cell division protein FtsQ n=2 Tax=Histidinibacterium lentulum TaxID=2480588 RepID=A0A3N2QZ15_9RHOB|nr:cell division protein FtsQ [Histidinibacterium lentulum]
MLTPGFRRTLRVGVPLALVTLLVGGWLAQESNRLMLRETAQHLREQFENRPEFMVAGLEIDGGDADLEAEVRDVMPGDFPVSSFDLDLEAMRLAVSALDRVESARVRVVPGGVLEVSVTPRVPAAVWRARDGLRLIDADGVFVAPLAARADRADLPLVVGEGAREALGEALALTEAAAPLAARVRGLVRMGERRWDLVLDEGQRILLPQEDPVRALERVLAIDGAQDLLGRDIAVVDMRNEARPTIRLNPAAAAAFRSSAEVRARQQAE